MAYDEYLADRLRQQLAERHVTHEEKRMMGGLCFMVNDKMCLGVSGERLMVRTDPAHYARFLALPGAREMDFTGRPMKGFLFVEGEGIDDDDALGAWVQRCLDYNPLAPRSKRRKKAAAA
ncbi:TfoX/Sxy family protein [Denitromonas iodatirespirans]|uniref:TfoX/Sxy family protein n=1 Tax=Denitromonas iodatirespirans TaxID=2795389 RepID=A0A944H7E7_DENI1|nr:TfoX/Sxy family protein [Denitromonas iodatirespirans]MBT0961104.1 TfoX/Sxy family protein [Denitromonas iodatirespirans]